MSRVKGLVGFSGNFELQMAAPLDAREVTETVADLTADSTWLALDGSSYAYVGMKTIVINDPNPENNGAYWLTALPTTSLANWEKQGTAGSSVTSINGRSGEVTLTKADVGLSLVDNTSDMEKPVSTAQETFVLDSITELTVELPITDKTYNIGNHILVEGAIYECIVNNSIWNGTITSNWERKSFNSDEVESNIATAISGLDTGILKLKPAPYVYNTLADAPTTGNEIGWVILVQEGSVEYFWGIPSTGAEETWVEFGKIDVVITEDTLQATFNETTDTLKNTLTAVQTYIDTNIQTVQNNKADLSYVNTELAGKQDALTAGANITIETVGEDIVISSTGGGSSGTYSNTGTLITVGGAEIGTVFANTPFEDVFDTIFNPELNPTLTNPSNTFSENAPTLVEVNVPTTIRFTANFNRGAITPAYETSGYRSGLPSSYNYTGPNLPASVDSTSLSNVQTLTDYVISTPSTVSWTSSVTYSAGEQPTTNKGNDYSTPLPGNTTSTKTVSVTAVYPFYATTVSITDMTKQALTNGQFFPATVAAEDDLGNKQSVEYALTASNELKGVEFFNTNSNKWEWLSGGKAESISNFTSSTITKTVNEVEIQYRKYVNNSSKVGSRQLRFYVS